MRPLPLPFALHVANEALAFLLELGLLAALGVWGAKTGATVAASVALGAGAPFVTAVLWGLFASPKARLRLPIAGVLAVKTLAFASGAAALYAVGWHGLASGFAAVAIANAVLAAFDRDAAKTATSAATTRRTR